MNKKKRKSWDEYFMDVCEMVSERGTCDRGKNGCVIVKDKQILSTGYVGSPPGLPHCDDVGHLLREVIHEDGTKTTHCIRTIHAEQNAIAHAAKKGIAIEGSTLYTKMTPCFTCAKIIAAAGIKRVVAKKDYHDSENSKKLFKDSGIEFVLLNNEVETYDNM